MWPDEVLVAVLRAATPEFRALVVTLLLTSQRLSDVVAFRPSQYDPETRTLGFTDRFAQQKTRRLWCCTCRRRWPKYSTPSTAGTTGRCWSRRAASLGPR
jgi:hypothetical protein